MTSPEQRWNGPIQDAIREHDHSLGHLPQPIGQPVSPVDWFRRTPNGGTVYARPDSGNPYSHVDEAEPRSEVVVELPEVRDED